MLNTYNLLFFANKFITFFLSHSFNRVFNIYSLGIIHDIVIWQILKLLRKYFYKFNSYKEYKVRKSILLRTSLLHKKSTVSIVRLSQKNDYERSLYLIPFYERF